MQPVKQKKKISASQQQLVTLMSQLAQLADDIIEECGEHRQDFITSLQQAHKDVRRQRVREVRSLAELV